MMAIVEPAPEDTQRSWSGTGLAVAAPLIVVALAAVLWLVSDRLLYIGPLDRATFGWVVVVPIWTAVPLAAGFAWRRLSPRAQRLAAVACGLVVGGLVAGLLWQASAFAGCVSGSSRTPAEWVAPAIAVGAVVGAGVGVGCLVATDQVRAGHPWRGLVAGAIGQLAVVAVAPVLLLVLFFPVCQRS